MHSNSFYELFCNLALNRFLFKYKILAITAKIITYGIMRKTPIKPPPTKVKKIPIKKMGMNGVDRM
jgi:hypothetical protein